MCPFLEQCTSGEERIGLGSKAWKKKQGIVVSDEF